MGFVANFILFPACTNFDNRLRFEKVTESLKVGTFWDLVYIFIPDKLQSYNNLRASSLWHDRSLTVTEKYKSTAEAGFINYMLYKGM